MSDTNKSKETRKTSIEELTEKYKDLVNDIYTACSKPLPTFTPIKNKDDEVIATEEEQLFKFIEVRNKALDSANAILFKINKLEIELYAPELLNTYAQEDKDEAPVKKNWAKKTAENK